MTASTTSLEILGHDTAIKEVEEAMASQRMHHAWLLSGIEGIGKTSLARNIAAHVLSGGEMPIATLIPGHPVAKLVLAETHPDLLIVRRGVDEKTGELKNQITVDEILSVTSFLHKTATHGGWRVVIVDEAHQLNRFGQNALLKILEEPPSKTLIMITVTTPGALLPTIRSRCRSLPLSPLSEETIQVLLRRTAPELPLDEVKELISLSLGSTGFALKIISNEVLPLYREVMNSLKGTFSEVIPRWQKLGESLSPKSEYERYDVLLALMSQHYKSILKEMAEKNEGSAKLGDVLRLIDRFDGLRMQADRANLDRKAVFLALLSELKHSQLASA